MLFGAVSCVMNAEISVKEAGSDKLTDLHENIRMIKTPVSFDVIDSDKFVLTDNEDVLVYDFSGNQLYKIGSVGNAAFEYHRPSVVRATSDHIFVWSSSHLKFVVYDIEGKPLAEYPYMSVVKDFRPTDSHIYIYTAGRREKNVVDVYSLSDKSVSDTLMISSDEHLMLSHTMSISPMAVAGGGLLFSSKDATDVYYYDGSEVRLDTDIESETFKVTEVPTSDWYYTDRDAARRWLRENSMSLYLSPMDKGYLLLTLEGERKLIDGKIDFDNLFYGAYEVRNGKIKDIEYYSFGSLGDNVQLFSSFSGKMYFIKHSIDREKDVYSLHRLIL